MQSNFAFMLGETKMTNKVHGGVQAGEFLTGNMDFFTINTVVPVAQTNVTTPVADLYQISSTVWSPVTVIDGNGTPVTYATEAAYTDAFVKQHNLNTMLKLFANRANPVAISVITTLNVDPSSTFGLGAQYNGTMEVATINIATEKSGLWFAGFQGNYGELANNTNLLGYQVSSEFQGVAVADLSVPVLATGYIETADPVTTNTVFARRTFL